MYPADGIPLKFGDAVAYARIHSHAQFAGALIVGEPCHEAAVDGSHQLEDILFGTSGGGKRQVFVVKTAGPDLPEVRTNVTGSPSVPEVVT